MKLRMLSKAVAAYRCSTSVSNNRRTTRNKLPKHYTIVIACAIQNQHCVRLEIHISCKIQVSFTARHAFFLGYCNCSSSDFTFYIYLEYYKKFSQFYINIHVSLAKFRRRLFMAMSMNVNRERSFNYTEFTTLHNF